MLKNIVGMVPTTLPDDWPDDLKQNVLQTYGDLSKPRYVGSVLAPCDVCGQKCWLGPNSQQALQDGTVVAKACLICLIRKVETGDMQLQGAVHSEQLGYPKPTLISEAN